MTFRDSGSGAWRSSTIFLPLVTIIVAVLMMPLPISLKLGGFWLMPCWPLMAIYLWTLYRPELVPPITVLLAGLFMDVVIGTPFGVSSLAFLAAYGITLSQRLYWLTLSGVGNFAGFAIMAMLAAIVTWLAVSFVHGKFVGFLPALLDVAVSGAVFPLVRRAFAPLVRLAGPVS